MARSRLGPLALKSKLGDHPSQSCVWRAIHTKHKRTLAVKVFSTPFGGTPETRTALASEWGQLQTLEHPAIARCYGGGFEDTDAYLVYEYVEGETLASQLQQRNRLPWEAVLDMSQTLVDALDYLHTKQVIHGALQPDKVIFAGLSPVLIDIRCDRAQTAYRNQRPPNIEELALRPPEMVNQTVDQSVATDLYMLGAMMYQSVTGRPPFDGNTIEEVCNNIINVIPASPASIFMECPVWLDRLIMQLLEKDPLARPNGAPAVKLALDEVRRRASSRAGVAEHASSGFSPLSVTDQRDRDVARKLLGRDELSFKEETPEDPIAWHDRPTVLISTLLVILAIFGYVFWPLNEDQMRQRAEALLASENRTSLMQAKNQYLIPLTKQFPEGQHVAWAQEEIERVEMIQAEHALSVKIKRNLPLKDEAERLYAEASEFERFGDTSTALDQYQSIVTLLSDDPNYRPFVNLARRQIGKIESEGTQDDEAVQMIQNKLAQADALSAEGKVIAARKIWYSVVELYANNDKVAPLVAKAQERLASQSASP